MTAEWTLGPETRELERVSVDWSRGVEGSKIEGGQVFKGPLRGIVVYPLRIVNVARLVRGGDHLSTPLGIPTLVP